MCNDLVTKFDAEPVKMDEELHKDYLNDVSCTSETSDFNEDSCMYM